MNYKERRQVKKNIAPIARKVVALEKNISAGINVEESEAEITRIVNSLRVQASLSQKDY